jgi:HlyD family secretion protein
MITESFISLIPDTPFQIEVDIYEEDVVKIEIGDLVEINFIAFPEKTFKGRVIAIDPAEKLIEGVVYYKVTIEPDNDENFEKIKEKLKPGMTADVYIEIERKENVLVIPQIALYKKEKKFFVKVLKEGIIKEREVKVGIFGSNDKVEILSGLKENEEIIILLK